MEEYTRLEIFTAGGKELVSFARLLEHTNSCEVCMLEEEPIPNCSFYEVLLEAWEKNRLRSLKEVLNVTKSV